MHRRHFIRNSALAAGALTLSNKTMAAFSVGKAKTALVLGAGLAGLSAANLLRKKGWEVKVLEARRRIGGRVFSHTIDEKEKLVIELGAEWVGASHSRLQELCEEYRLKLHNNQFDTHLIYKGRYFANQQWDYSKEWQQKFAQIIADYPQFSQEDKERLDRMDWWRFLVNNGCTGRDLDLRELLDSTDFGESIRHVSAFAALAEYAESSPKNEMDYKIQGGNSRLAEALADAIGRAHIHTGHRVTRVQQDPSGKAIVVCDNGKSFTADKLICTLPTYALTKIDWQPGLDSAYQAAVNALQYARINKNPILFRDRFWRREDFDMVTDQSPHYFYHATKNQPSKKGVLISYTIGEKAAVVANQSEQWRAQQAANTLSLAFGSVRSKMEKQLNYYWGNDEFSQGAYALYGKGQWFGLMPVLKRPHIHCHFAGEHLAEWQGFMEGAINSGEEVAEQL